MSKTVEARKEYGLSYLGYVFIHHFKNQAEDRFEVRAGNHTVDIKSNFKDADKLALALVDK